MCSILTTQIVRRSSLAEKYLVVVKYRLGHKCATAWIVVCMVAWDGVPRPQADQAYDTLSYHLVRGSANSK